MKEKTTITVESRGNKLILEFDDSGHISDWVTVFKTILTNQTFTNETIDAYVISEQEEL
jgi:hypothetical protein